MSTTAPSEIWNNILKGNIEKDDPLWQEYLDKAAVFDVRMVDGWNKIVDVLLVYVALFISVLTSFIIQTFTQFQRNPADITNDLLVAIYDQLAAQSNNTSIPPVDPRSYFHQSKVGHHNAVVQNALLYTSLSLSIAVSVIALMAKLWLVNYSHQAFSVGSPYERAMKRQEAYNGVLVWNLGGVINILPVILLIALFLFEIYAFTSVIAVQTIIGLVIGTILNLNVLFLGFTSLGGAFIPGCPFRSTISDAIRWMISGILLVFRCFPKRSRRFLFFLFASALWGLSILMPFLIPYDTITTGTWFLLILIPASIFIAYSAQHEVFHKPQRYKISHLALWVFLSISAFTIIAVLFPFIIILTTLGIFGACNVVVKISKSMEDTGEIDAIAWLLTTAPPQNPATFFKKAGQMTGDYSIGRHYRPRLLESLMPFLTLLITSHQTPELPGSRSDIHSPSSSPSIDQHLENLEIYTACLARLSEFTDCRGSCWCLWEDARWHPELHKLLIYKLVVLADPRHRFDDLRSAAIKVLNNYKLDRRGNALSRVTVVRSVATGLMSAAFLTRMLGVRELNSQFEDSEERGLPNLHRPVELATRIEPPHSTGEIEEA